MSAKGINPHYPAVAAEFERIFWIFSSFVDGAGLGDLAIELCEMTYINHFGVWPRDVALTPRDWLRGWSGDRGPEWDGETEDVAATCRFVLRGRDGTPNGRLTAAASTIIAAPAGDRALQLEITVRGLPGRPGFDGVREFHDMAHDQIVRCFAAMTTESAHEHWGREPA